MGGISVHAVDIAAGLPAAQLRVDLLHLAPGGAIWLFQGRLTDAAGKIVVPNDARGRFEAIFHLGDYLRAAGHRGALFQDRLTFAFGIDAPARHHHLPLKFTAFGHSLFLTH